MFVKGYIKYNKITKESYFKYKLCESYRINGMVRYYVTVGLGKLEVFETAKEQGQLASRIEEMLKGNFHHPLG